MATGQTQPVSEFALFELGSQRMGVPSHHVVQAIAYPEQVSRLPRSRQALAGVFVHRGQVLPLLDLRQWMEAGSTSPAAAAQQVLILKAGQHRFAMAIDALKGLLRVLAGDVQKIHHDEDAHEFFHSVVRADDGSGLISLLDPQRLARQAQVWAEAGVPDTAAEEVHADHTADAAPVQATTCAVVRLDNLLLALPASAVGEVRSGMDLQRLAGVDRHFLGMAQWRGQELPVLDLARVLDLPPAASRPAPWTLVVSLHGRALAFHVQEICAVRSFEAAAVQAGGAVSPAMQRLSTGSCLLPSGERVYLLDACALLDASPLSNRKDPAQADQLGHTLRLGYHSRSRSEALVVFKSRQLWAASMRQMREIVPLPAAVHDSFVHDGLLPASMEWRGQAVPLWDLRKMLLGQTSQVTHQARVILVQEQDRTTGLLVESVDALIPGHTGSRLHFVTQGMPVEMVTVGGSGVSGPQASYQLLDLQSVQEQWSHQQPHSGAQHHPGKGQAHAAFG